MYSTHITAPCMSVTERVKARCADQMGKERDVVCFKYKLFCCALMAA